MSRTIGRPRAMRRAIGMQKKWLQCTRSIGAGASAGEYQRTVGGAGAHRGLVAVEKGPEAAHEEFAGRQTRRKRHAGEEPRLLRRVPASVRRNRARSSVPCRRKTRDVAAGHRGDSRAQAAIGLDLAEHDGIGAAGMPGRMDDGDGLAREDPVMPVTRTSGTTMSRQMVAHRRLFAEQRVRRRGACRSRPSRPPTATGLRDGVPQRRREGVRIGRDRHVPQRRRIERHAAERERRGDQRQAGRQRLHRLDGNARAGDRRQQHEPRRAIDRRKIVTRPRNSALCVSNSPASFALTPPSTLPAMTTGGLPARGSTSRKNHSRLSTFAGLLLATMRIVVAARRTGHVAHGRVEQVMRRARHVRVEEIPLLGIDMQQSGGRPHRLDLLREHRLETHAGRQDEAATSR